MTADGRRHGAAIALRAILVALGLLTAAGMAGVGWLLLAYAKRPGPGPAGQDVHLPPPAELGVDGLTTHLHDAGAIQDPDAFRSLLSLLNVGPHLRTTRTVIRPDQSVEEMLPLLARGRGSPVLHLTFPEGFTRFDFAKRLAQYGVATERSFLTATEVVARRRDFPARSVEGYLFPDTYQLRVPSATEPLVERLINTFEKRVGAVMKAHRAAVEALQQQLGFSERDIVTLASVVEKEAQLPRERPIIAGVFLNRLRDPDFRPHRLQADPTVAYGCQVAPEAAVSCREFDGRRVTPAMVRDPDNPYNTYRHDGLPPGPICSPGTDAVLAVLEATEHAYYYFVAQGDGSHRFSRTLEDHNRAIAETRGGR